MAVTQQKVQAPALKHRVVGTDPQGTYRERPFEKGWKATAEARKYAHAGWTGVEVQSWDKAVNDFRFAPQLNQHLQDNDKPRITVNDDALDSIARLAPLQKHLFTQASKGNITEESLKAFMDEVNTLLKAVGMNGEEGEE